MDYSKGYTASFYACFLDPKTWMEEERIEIISGSINRSEDGLRSNAELTVREYDQPVDRWIRIYMDADQNGSRTHEALFTGIVSTPGDDRNGAVTKYKLSAYSPLKAAEDIKLQTGWYVPAKADGLSSIKELLGNQPAPVDAKDSETKLEEAIIAESNENCVTMIDRILTAMNWKMQIEGDGTVLLSPIEEDPEPEVVISPESNDVIESSFSRSRDWFSCPNVLTASSGSRTYTQKDEDPDSDLSVPSRGREVQEYEDNVILVNNESLQNYTARRLKELQARTEKVSYSRRFLPNVNVGSVIKLEYPDLKGVFTVEAQDITLGVNAKTSEDVRRTV